MLIWLIIRLSPMSYDGVTDQYITVLYFLKNENNPFFRVGVK